MKKILLDILSLALIVGSCSNETASFTPVFPSQSTTKSSFSPKKYDVSKEDVVLLLGNHIDISRIKSFPSDDDVQLHIVKLDTGFVIVSGDKRAYPIVAYSQEDNINMENEETISLFEEYASPIREIKSSSWISKEMEGNLTQWEKIVGTPVTTKTENTTYFYLIESQDENYYSANIGPLLSTRWGQSDHNTNDHYWNEYCPWSDSTCTGPKCPVGCVAVSAGQFAYYMRNRTGVSILLPSTVVCNGYAGNYSRSFSTANNANMINIMPLNYLNTNSTMIKNARIFLAYIGKRVDMNYGPTSSGANTSNLVPLLSEWGINSTYISFQNSEAIAQLRNSTPIITRGKDDIRNKAHSWVIDGYQRFNTIRKNYYYVSERELTEEEINNLTMDDWNGGYDEWLTGSGQFYHMNWGWNGVNNGWFSIDNWSLTTRDYSTGKAMIKIN